MENNRSLLLADHIPVSEQITLRIPTIGEILEDEQNYMNLISYFTSSPYSFMVMLDDIGVDFSTITSFELFLIFAETIFQSDHSILFGETDLSHLSVYTNQANQETVLYDPETDLVIDKYIFGKIADAIRSMNLLKEDLRKPGNDAAKKYLIDKQRRYQRRHADEPFKPQIENLVIALVNKQEFKYNYEEVLNLSIFKFNQSVRQIRHTVSFDKIMIGVYAGTVDTTKLTDKSVLSFIPDN